MPRADDEPIPKAILDEVRECLEVIAPDELRKSLRATRAAEAVATGEFVRNRGLIPSRDFELAVLRGTVAKIGLMAPLSPFWFNQLAVMYQIWKCSRGRARTDLRKAIQALLLSMVKLPKGQPRRTQEEVEHAKRYVEVVKWHAEWIRLAYKMDARLEGPDAHGALLSSALADKPKLVTGHHPATVREVAKAAVDIARVSRSQALERDSFRPNFMNCGEELLDARMRLDGQTPHHTLKCARHVLREAKRKTV